MTCVLVIDSAGISLKEENYMVVRLEDLVGVIDAIEPEFRLSYAGSGQWKSSVNCLTNESRYFSCKINELYVYRDRLLAAEDGECEFYTP